MMRVLTTAVQAIGIGIALLMAVVPAHALTTNQLLFELNVPGTGPGGNLSDADIAALILTNEALLGQDITVIGKINVGGAFEAEPGFGGTFSSFACSNPVNNLDCQTGFTVNFDFSSLADDFQIVKVAVKSGQNDIEVFFIDPAALQSGSLDPFQAGAVSDGERIEACGTGCQGVSNIVVFAAGADQQQQVPEPVTVGLLGLSVVGAAFVARRKK